MKKGSKAKAVSLHTIAKFAGLKFSRGERKAAENYPFLASNYYLGLIGKDLKRDPVFRQCFPDSRELASRKELSEDPLAEERQMPVPCLIHRYRDRVVLLVTNRCAVHCRFCFRKRKWKEGAGENDISNADLDAATRYISGHREIREVLVSGGDPFMLEAGRLKTILSRFSRMGQIDVIRIGTRIPVVLPQRVDQSLADMLSNVPRLWIMTHFNHPAELTLESEEACMKLVEAGIPVLNQTVLLKGINDNHLVLEKLFRGLARIKVKPHYLFHCDPAEGNAHFRTGIQQGLRIMKQLRPRLSSVCTPVFALDLPEGGGKIPLQPDYLDSRGFEAIDGRSIRYC